MNNLDQSRYPVSASDFGRNLFISPVSLYSAFAIVLAGCRENSEKQLKKVLGISVESSSMHKSLGTILQNITSVSEYCKVILANTMFVEKEFEIKSKFSDLVKSHYAAVPEQV